MTRYQLIERILRHVYGEQPTDDSNITSGLVNQWINDGIGVAAKQNYKDAIQLDGISYNNNSFYTSFTNLPIKSYQQFIYQITLPQIPVGVGRNEGISTLQFVDVGGKVSFTAVPLSQNQVGYYQSMKPIPNKILYYPEGIYAYAISTLLLNIGFTVNVRMVSGGDSTNLNSILNVPDDYIPLIIDYVSKMLIQERAQPKILANQGEDL
jgi:hypothetical protein